MSTGLLRSVLSLRLASGAAALVTGLATVVVFLYFTAFTLLAAGVTLGLLTYAVFGRAPFDWLDDDTDSGLVSAEQDAPDTDSATSLVPSLAVDDPRVPGILTAVFLLASATSVLTLTTAYYGKPLAYYLALAVAAGAIVLRVFLTEAHRTSAVLAFLLGLNSFVSNQLAFPLGLNGPDIGDHVGLAQNIVATGHIVGGGTYNDFPGQHVLAATHALVEGGPVQPTYRAVGIAAMLLGLPLTYLVARRLGDHRFAVLAMVFYGTMDYVIYRAGHPSKLAYALPLLFLVFACVLYLYERAEPGLVALFALFSTALVFTHPHTAFNGFLMLGAMAVGQYLGPRLESVATGKPLRLADGGRADESIFARRSHVFALLFGIVFLMHFIYVSNYFATFLTIASEYVDVLFVSGGSDAVKETPRFAAIPQSTIFINTIGSALLAGFVAMGVLDLLDRGVQLSYVVVAWTIVAGVTMVVGVIGDVPFALPNRVWVMAEITAFGFFAAAGLAYVTRRGLRSSVGAGRTVVVVVVALMVVFTLFSAGSTIAGPETSPFNEDFTYRTWYSMTEGQAADDFLASVGVNTSEVRAARGLPLQEDRTFNYSTVESGQLLTVNTHKASTGVTVGGGGTRIGGVIYAFPSDPKAGLENSTRFYDNGPVSGYKFGR